MKKMYRQWLTVLGVSALFASMFAVTVSALVKEVPIRGAGAGQITGVAPGPNGTFDLTAVGSGTATHLGKFTRSENISFDPVAGTLSGSITFVSADGEELSASFTAAFISANEAVGTYVFTGGTGRFTDASGSAPFSVVQSDPANFTFAFAGTIDLK